MKKNRCICFFVNKKYLFALATIIVNLKDKNVKYDDIVVYYDDLTYEDISKLKLIEENIVFISYTLDDFVKDFRICLEDKTKKLIERYSHLNYCKFKVCELLEKYNKVLYLDVDMLIMDDLDELFSIDGIAWRPGYNFMEGFITNIIGIDPKKHKLTMNIPDNYYAPNGGLFYITDIISYKDAIKNGYDFLREFLPIGFRCIDELSFAFITFKQDVCTILDRYEYSTHPTKFRPLTKVVHFYGNQKPWNDALLLGTFPEWYVYYRRALDITGIICCEFTRERNVSYLLSKKNEELWFRFFNTTKFKIKNCFYIDHIYKNKNFIMYLNKDIYYEIINESFSPSFEPRNFSFKLNIRNAQIMIYRDEMKKLINGYKDILDIVFFEEEKDGISLKTKNVTNIKDANRTFERFFSITKLMLEEVNMWIGCNVEDSK